MSLVPQTRLELVSRFFCSFMDTIYSSRVVSTKAGQDHRRGEYR